MAVLAGDDEATLAARVLAAEHALYPAVLRMVLGGGGGGGAARGTEGMLLSLLPTAAPGH